MTTVLTEGLNTRKGLRLWPGVVAVVLQWLVRYVLPFVFPQALLFAVLGELVGGVAVVVWWLFFSRAAWLERIGALVVMILGLAATSRVVHESIAGGMMGNMLVIYAIPVLSLAVVAWAVATSRLSDRLRRASLFATILLACGVFTLIRTGGLGGSGGSDLHWRWTKTPEQQLLAGANDEPTIRRSPAAAVNQMAEWPGFRGPERDGVVRGLRIETDWSQSPPVQLWRRPIGPGWSSFAVSGNLAYTHQREDLVCAVFRLHTDLAAGASNSAGPHLG